MTEIPTRKRRDTLNPDERKLEAWPLADVSNLPPDARADYERRYQAITGYMYGEPHKELTKKWKLSRWEIKRLRDRCLSQHPDGRLWGFRGLLPFIRLRLPLRLTPRPRTMERGRGFGGELKRILNLYPKTRDKVYRHHLRKRAGANEAWVPIASTHKVMIDSLRQENASTDEWPFTSGDVGKEALRVHLRALAKSDMYASVRAQYGVEAARALNTGTGVSVPSAVTLPFQRVLFDGHRIDGLFTLLLPHPKGGFIELVANRPWLLVVLDVATRCTLGWTLSLNREYNQEDVLRCFHAAITPWQPRKLTIDGLSYHPKGGMPSAVVEKARWAVWDEVSYDNARSHLSDWVRHQLGTVLNCAINPGAVNAPERLGILEALWRALNAKHIHRLPNTVGSNPQDPKRHEPEEAAKRYRISMAHLEELLDVIIANHNGEPHSALCWRSPLEQLRFFLEVEGTPLRYLRSEEQTRTNLLEAHFRRKVCGDPKRGRRPYIQFEVERYTNEVLARSPDLIGSMLTLVVNTRDLRTVTAFLPNGAELGILTAMGKWAQTPHTLATRRAANRRKVLAVQHHVDLANVDPVHVLLAERSQEALSDKRAAMAYETIRKDAELAPNFHPKEMASKAKTFELPTQPVRKLITKRRSIVY
jgi:putative transposase